MGFLILKHAITIQFFVFFLNKNQENFARLNPITTLCVGIVKGFSKRNEVTNKKELSLTEKIMYICFEN